MLPQKLNGTICYTDIIYNEGRGLMHTLKDYVNFVANSMSVKLSEDDLNKITKSLINNKNYNLMLEDLERMINISREGK